jgi:hypothetical protein
MTPMEMARFNATSKSTRMGGRGIISRPTMTIKPPARAISLDLKRFLKLEVLTVGFDATIS